MTTLFILGLFGVIFLLRFPVGVSMLVVSIVALLVFADVPFVVIPQYMISSATKDEFLAIPFFILAAEIMNSTGMTERLFRFASVLTSWMRGGLAQVNIVASVVFAGISGTSVADAAGLGRVEIEAMRRAGYDLKLSAGLTIASCIIGPLIPPSVVVVIYAITAEVSIGRMLLAGAGPGLLLAAALMVTVWWMAKRDPKSFPAQPRPTRQEFKEATFDGLPAVLTPFIILIGVVGGVITTTEAGVAACAYSVLVSLFWYRSFTIRHFYRALVRTVLATSMIMMLIAAASVMSFLITREQAAVELLQIMSSMTESVWLQLLIINIFLLLVGAALEGIPAMLILVPLMLPMVTEMGIDPIHFGIILIFNLLVGIITPPVGVGLFILSGITGLRVGDVFRGCVPFLGPLIVTLIIITYVPAVTLWLPDLLLPEK